MIPIHATLTLTCIQVDTGRELKRVTWNMMRTVICQTIAKVEMLLNQIKLPGQVGRHSYIYPSFFILKLTATIRTST